MITRIVVIDDEPLICQLLTYQLGGAGYEVRAYQNGAQALRQLPFDQPDLVLLDVMMPGVSGWDLCRQIRSSSEVPVIMLTAKHSDDDIVTGLTSGADDYVGKPFSERQLIARIETVLRRSRIDGRRATPPPLIRTARPLPTPSPSSTMPATPEMAVAPSVLPAVGAPRPVLSAPPDGLPRLGPALADARQQRGLSLHDAERACGVRWEFLQAIEQEQFTYMPRPQLRSALHTYSGLLEFDLQPYVGGRVHHPSAELSLTRRLAVSAALLLLLLLMLVVLAL